MNNDKQPDASDRLWAFVHEQMNENELKEFQEVVEKDPALKKEGEQMRAMDQQLHLLATINKLSEDELKLIREGFVGNDSWSDNPEAFAKVLEQLWNQYGVNQLNVTMDQVGEAKVVRLAGALDTVNVDAFNKVMQPLCAQGARFVVDCVGLSYVNSMCLALLHKYSRECAAKGGKLVFCCFPQRIEQIIRMLGLHNVLNITPTPEDAIKAAMA